MSILLALLALGTICSSEIGPASGSTGIQESSLISDPFTYDGSKVNTTGDKYEDNNNIDDAVDLTSKSAGERNSYVTGISATINYVDSPRNTELDIDYYRFNVFSNASVSVSLSALPLNKNIILEVWSTCRRYGDSFTMPALYLNDQITS
jgi:hypothetical protein